MDGDKAVRPDERQHPQELAVGVKDLALGVGGVWAALCVLATIWGLLDSESTVADSFEALNLLVIKLVRESVEVVAGILLVLMYILAAAACGRLWTRVRS